MGVYHFVVLGDVHYVREASHKRALAGEVHSPTEQQDVCRNLWMTQNHLPNVLAEVSVLRPDFIVQLGDFVQGHCDDEEAGVLEMKEALEFFRSVNIPLFFACGTHDKTQNNRPLKEMVCPLISRQLGRPVEKFYYDFLYNGDRFIVLDYTTFRPDDDQDQWLKATLAEAAGAEHIFVFAHAPLYLVARPFFSSLSFVRTVRARLAESQRAVDAYFCGHTHNQVASAHKLSQERWLPQLQSTPLGYKDRPPLPLEAVRVLLPAEGTWEYGWGFMEDTAPGFWHVVVDGSRVTIEWRCCGYGTGGQVVLEQPGRKPVFSRQFSQVDHDDSPALLPGVSSLTAVQLRAAGMGCRSNRHRVALNGVEIGFLPLLEYFDCRQAMEIRPEYWHLLRRENTVSVYFAEDECCLGGFVLEAVTHSGKVYRSSVSQGLYTNSHRWDEWEVGCLEHVQSGSVVNLLLSYK